MSQAFRLLKSGTIKLTFMAAQIASFMSLISCIKESNGIELRPSFKRRIPRVTLVKLKMSSVQELFEFPGIVQSSKSAKIYAEARGWVDETHVGLGDRVKRNSMLVTIQNRDPIYRYSKLIVRSPISGVVSKFPVSQGSHVGPDDMIAEVVDPSELFVKTHVPILESNLIEIGKKGRFEGATSRTLIASKRSPVVDTVTGTSTIIWKFPPGEREGISIGMQGSVVVQGTKRSRMMVPESALVYRDGLTHLPVVRNLKNEQEGIVELRPVQVGERRFNEVEITDGAEEAEWFVLKTTRGLEHREKVQIDEFDESSYQQ